MVAILENIISTITTSLPLAKVSNWTVKIKQDRKLNPINASDASDFLDVLKNDIKWGQETISGFFQYTESSSEDIAEFDSFISVNGSHNSQIVKNAIENGTFRSVNKIKDPNKIVVELAKGGYKAGVEEVLNKLKKYQDGTALCTVITPFGPINNLNLIGLDYTFSTDNGSNLLIAKLTFQEIVYSKETAKSPKYPSWQKLSDMGRKAKSIIGW